MAWEWHAFDLRTGTRRTEVPMVAWSHTERLNDSGEWSGELAPHADADRVAEVVAATIPTRCVVVGLRDGVIEGDGIVWRRNVPAVAGAGLLSFFDRRHLLEDVEYLAMDQHAMFSDLVLRGQTAADGSGGSDGDGADIAVSAVVAASGVPRDQTWQSWEAKKVGEALRQKAAINGGPDFVIRSELDAGQVVRRLRCWTPFRGRRFEDSKVVFTLGQNAYEVDPDEDGIVTTTRAIAIGEETDSVTQERPVATATADDLIAAGWPMLDTVVDLRDVTDSLQDHADGYVELFGRPQQDELTLRIDPAYAALWEVGDECMVVIPPWSTSGARTWIPDYVWLDGEAIAVDPDGSPILVSDETVDVDRSEQNRPHPWYPDGYTARRRIVARRWDVDGRGEALYAITGPVVDD